MNNNTPVHWIRSNGFVLAMAAAVALAFLLPEPGSREGFLHAGILTNVGIALILFLQGISMPLEEIRSSAANWRLHVIIQSFTFVIFPMVGLLFHFILPFFWPEEPEAIRAGFLYLCVLPSTISTSVVLTAAAGGNTAGALFNAAFSNILGVVLTPILVQLLMRSTGQAGAIGPLLLKIAMLTLLPFVVGMALRKSTKDWVDSHKQWVTYISNAVVVFIVYAAFCDSVMEKIWERHGLLLTSQTLAVVILLFIVISLLTGLACRVFSLNRGDAIAAYFCSVKKTLAMGVPLAILIFGERADLSLILLPIMFYHPLQLVANGMLANHWAKSSPAPVS